MVTFDKMLPNIKNVLDKHFHILSINEQLKKVFDEKRSLPVAEIRIYTK